MQGDGLFDQTTSFGAVYPNSSEMYGNGTNMTSNRNMVKIPLTSLMNDHEKYNFDTKVESAGKMRKKFPRLSGKEKRRQLKVRTPCQKIVISQINC